MGMYKKIDNNTLQKLAGYTVIADGSCAEIRQGRWRLASTAIEWVQQTITFSDPMPDNDYVVIIESDNQSWAAQPGPYKISNKTATGFMIASYNMANASSAINMDISGTYTAVKLIPMEGYTELKNKVDNPDTTPTENSTNLCTSGGIYEAIKNASSVFVGTRAEWAAATQTDYDIAVITDEHKILSIDKTAGTTAEQANLNKIWRGTQAEWDALTPAEKDEWEEAQIIDHPVETSILEKIYSVGALYFNTADVDPAEIFGFGTWERVAKNMALWGASADGQGGTTKAAGLPNITGDGLNTELSWNDPKADGYGCFRSIKGPDADRYRPIGGDKTCCYRYYSLDASRSNPIYGASTTVQPPAFIVNIWRRTA